jgi:hypothetical protein
VAPLNEWGWCADPACAAEHVRALLPAPPYPKRGKKTDVLCPGCGKWNADFNTAEVPKVHLVGSCHPLQGRDVPCSNEQMLDALTGKFHIDPIHLGLFGKPAKPVVPASSPRRGRATPGEAVAARKWFAARGLPLSLSLHLRLMCEQAIDDWGGDYPPSDPRELLRLDYDIFIALAKRTGGIDPTYRGKLWRQWAQHQIWEQ